MNRLERQNSGQMDHLLRIEKIHPTRNLFISKERKTRFTSDNL